MGAAIMGAVTAGIYSTYEEAVRAGVSMEKCYTPHSYNEKKKEAFRIMYKAMIQAQY